MTSDGVPEQALVTVASFEWLPEAELARSRLAACGIASHLPEEFFGSIYWTYAKAIGGLRLQVGEADAEDARAVLEEPPQEVEATLSAADAVAERFLRTAVFAMAAFPLLLYALWLLPEVYSARKRLGASARRQAASGAVLLLIFFLWAAALSLAQYLR